MPAYDAYLPQLYATGKGPAPRKQWKFQSDYVSEKHFGLIRNGIAPVLKIEIDNKRLPREVKLL